MDIQGYIIDHWLNKMNEEHPVLTIYDAGKKYHALLSLLEERGVKVIDTSKGFLHARISSSDYWMNEISMDKNNMMVVYRTVDMPSSKRDWIFEPFAAFSKCNPIFPIGPQDEYKNMCRAFLPNKTKELDALFANGSASFNMVNALLDGANYPELEELTGGKSFAEITIELLKLQSCNSMSWLNEWRSFAEVQYPGLDASGGCLKEIQYKLWSYVLFSEFVFDLPGILPESLESVARAPEEMKDKVYMICDNLRNQINLRDTYVQMADRISEKLNLSEVFNSAKHLGNRVTFNFENTVEFKRFNAYLTNNELEEAKKLLQKNINDVWYQQDSEVATFWNLAKCATDMFDTIERGIKTDGTLKDMVNWYAESGCMADKAMRDFYTIKINAIVLPDQIKELENLLKKRYSDFIERGVTAYQKEIKNIKDFPELKNQGCPQMVYPALKEGKRVVFVMVDAFRYEMAKAFATSMERSFKGKVECSPRISILPSVTRFGMANHLDDISMQVIDGKLMPLIGDKVIALPQDRINYLSETLKCKIQDVRLEDIENTIIDDDTRLLVVRSVYIDTAGESEKLDGLASMTQEMKRLARLTNLCKHYKFDMMVFVADHGFMLQPAFRTSDQIAKPKGCDICLDESRMIAGNINDSVETISFSPRELGADTNVMKFCYAKNFTVFERGQVYYHEGISLQENVVPMVKIVLQEKKAKPTFNIKLSYKGEETGTVYMLRPIIQIKVFFDDLFTEDINIRLKVTDENGVEIGVPMGGSYDDVTELINIPMNVTGIKQPIGINEDFNGSVIVVTALNAETNATLHTMKLNFEND